MNPMTDCLARQLADLAGDQPRLTDKPTTKYPIDRLTDRTILVNYLIDN
jgi:hypothetical protein